MWQNQTKKKPSLLPSWQAKKVDKQHEKGEKKSRECLSKAISKMGKEGVLEVLQKRDTEGVTEEKDAMFAAEMIRGSHTNLYWTRLC